MTELSNTLCELLEWKRPNGKLKYEECRALLERLQADGFVTLPALRKTSPHGPRQIRVTSSSDPQSPLTGNLSDYLPLSLQLVRGADASRSALFNQFIDRYHYLGYRVPFGAHLRYLVGSEQLPDRYLACLLFSSPAWKMAPRDAWIGWSSEQRQPQSSICRFEQSIPFVALVPYLFTCQ